MFEHAIVRPPGRNLTDGLRACDLGIPDPALARGQHAAYVDALRTCGLAVTALAPDERHADSTFVEDTALLTPRGAILTRPGAPSRRGEVPAVAEALRRAFDHVVQIDAPGTVDAGDVLAADGDYVVGLSARTNEAGAAQLCAALAALGYRATTTPVGRMLHLKSGVSYLDNGRLVATGELAGAPAFAGYEILRVDEAEAYAANCVWLNGRVLVAAGYPRTAAMIAAAGYDVIELDVSEFRKVDGGLSCLSLRY